MRVDDDAAFFPELIGSRNAATLAGRTCGAGDDIGVND